jgi:hypothetical protein
MIAGPDRWTGGRAYAPIGQTAARNDQIGALQLKMTNHPVADQAVLVCCRVTG